MEHHLDTSASRELVEDLVERLEVLGIKPQGLDDPTTVRYLITSWGMALPGAGLHAERAQEIIAGATSAPVLLARAQILMRSRAMKRAQDRAC